MSTIDIFDLQSVAQDLGFASREQAYEPEWDWTPSSGPTREKVLRFAQAVSPACACTTNLQGELTATCGNGLTIVDVGAVCGDCRRGYHWH